MKKVKLILQYVRKDVVKIIYDPFAKKNRIEGQPFDDGIDNPFAQLRKNNGIDYEQTK